MVTQPPWFNEDDYVNPNPYLNPDKFPGVNGVPQTYWNQYWYENPPGALITFPKQPDPVPWTGFSTNAADKAAGPKTITGGGGAGGGGGTSGGGGGNNSIKTAGKELSIDEIIKRDKLEEQKIVQLFLTDIGARELVTLSRHDEISGINQGYSPIKNLSDISLKYNPLAISPNADNVTTYLTSFNFEISKYIPTQQELDEQYPLDEDVDKRKVIYFDKDSNSLVVHVKNIFVKEKIEVEFIIPQEVKDGTIYT
jgi:hypothetical protein